MKNECYKYAKGIADDIKNFDFGFAVKCPECGEIHVDEKLSFDGNAGTWSYPCGCESEFEPETLSIIDYFDDALDIEYTLNSNFDLVGVNIYVTLGGPTCWIDTARSCVVCHWGLDEATVYFDSNISSEINDYFEDCISSRLCKG